MHNNTYKIFSSQAMSASGGTVDSALSTALNLYERDLAQSARAFYTVAGPGTVAVGSLQSVEFVAGSTTSSYILETATTRQASLTSGSGWVNLHIPLSKSVKFKAESINTSAITSFDLTVMVPVDA